MDYQRTGSVLHDDVARLLHELEDQMVKSEWKMIPIDSLHGFLTAVAIGPRLIMPSKWLPKIFFQSDELPEFKDDAQAEQVIHAILNVYNGVLTAIQEKTFAPFITYKEENGVEKEEFAFWCNGFVIGTFAFETHEWDFFEDEELANILLPVLFHSTTDQIKDVYTDEQLKHMEELGQEYGDLIIDAVYDLREYLNDGQLPEMPMYEDMPEERLVPKIRRNQPCPCGSGKKYKKCCGKNG